MKKVLIILLFSVVTLGFVWGFVTYTKSMSDMLDKEVEIDSPVVQEDNLLETPVETEVENEIEEIEETPINVQEKKVPSVLGLSQEEAEALLVKEGFKYKVYLEEKKGTKVNTVFYQRPWAEKSVPLDEVIHFSVSKEVKKEPVASKEPTTSKDPVKAENIKVPSVTGLSEKVARDILEPLGFKITTKSVSNAKLAGEVIAQSLPSGTSAKKGETITLTISLGEKDPEQGDSAPSDKDGEKKDDAFDSEDSSEEPENKDDNSEKTNPESQTNEQPDNKPQNTQGNTHGGSLSNLVETPMNQMESASDWSEDLPSDQPKTPIN